MIKGNTKKFINNIFAEFDGFYDSPQGVADDIKAAGSIRHFVDGGGHLCYYSNALNFLARVYENTEEERKAFDLLPNDKIWERYIGVISVYLPKWLKARGVN